MAKKIPLKIGEKEVVADVGSFKVSVTIPKKYRKLMKYVALAASFAAIYFGYTLSI